MAHRKRSREKEEFWRLVMQEFASSGQSVRQFCRSQQLSEGSFFAWRRELARRDAEADRPSSAVNPLVPIQIVDRGGPTANHSANSVDPVSGDRIEVELPEGIVVRFSASVSTSRLREVLDVVTLLEAGAERC